MSALVDAVDVAGTAASTLASTGGAVDILATRHAYVAFALLLCIGLYMMIANPNLVKKIIGLNLFQTAIFLLFIASAYVEGGSIPIVPTGGPDGGLYVSPLPHVLVLTAIVVGVSLTAVALALCIRIYDEYGTLRADTLRELLRDEGSIPARRSAEASGVDDASGANGAQAADDASGAADAGGGADD